jgi:hypothetical protein
MTTSKHGFKIVTEKDDNGSPKPIVKKDSVEPDKSFSETVLDFGVGAIDTITDLPSDIYKIATGEGVNIEFPNLPEATEIPDVGFFEGLGVNAKIMFARDDYGKAEIIDNYFKSDERYGGIKYDKFNLPMVLWNKKPYYINKPGLTKQDIGTFVGEVIKFFPASRYVQGARTIKGMITRGVPLYTLTELGSDALESFLAPKTAKTKQEDLIDKSVDALKMGGIGTAIDVVTPPILKAPVQAAKLATRGGAKILNKPVPKFAQPLERQKSIYPLSSGQASAQLDGGKPSDRNMNPDLMREEQLRYVPEGDVIEGGARGVITAFDNKQLNMIKNDAMELMSRHGSGKYGKQPNQIDNLEEANVGLESVDEIKTIISSEAGNLKSIAQKNYKFVEGALDAPYVSVEGVKKLKQLINTPRVKELMDIDLKGMPKFKDAFNDINVALKNIIKKGQPIDFRVLQRYQRRLNQMFRDAEIKSTDKVYMGELKSTVDNFIFKGIDNGFITGNENIIKSLKEATDSYKQYIGLTGKGGVDNRVKAIMQKIVDPDLSPKEVINAFFGHSKFNPSPVMKKVLNNIKNNLPENKVNEVFALIKDGILEKAFAGTGKSGITRTNIVNNFNEIFVKNRFFIDEIFTPQEIAQIKQFRENVLPTLFAEIKTNPSGTSYTLVSAMTRAGILNSAKKLQGLPFIKEMSDVMKREGAINEALELTSQYVLRSNKPLFNFPIPKIRALMGGKLELETVGIASDTQALTTELKEDITETGENIEDESFVVPDFVKALPQSAREKILQAQ